jgi:hypothetical protein
MVSSTRFCISVDMVKDTIMLLNPDMALSSGMYVFFLLSFPLLLLPFSSLSISKLSLSFHKTPN